MTRKGNETSLSCQDMTSYKEYVYDKLKVVSSHAREAYGGVEI